MSGQNTVGSFVLKAILVLVAFNFIFTVIKMMFDYLGVFTESVTSRFGTGWWFSIVVDFLMYLFKWETLVFTDVMGFATIIFLALIEEAYSTKWK